MIVSAVGICVGAIDPANNGLADRVAEAMRQAVIKAQAEGVTDPDVIRSRMMEAKDKCLAPSPESSTATAASA